MRLPAFVLVISIAMNSFSADSFAQWVPGGIPVAPAGGKLQDIAIPARDSQGGLYVAWRDYRSGPDSDAYLQRLTPDGFFSKGWTPSGLLIATGPTSQTALRMVSDEAGGVLVAWIDAVFGGYDLRAQRIQSNGSIMPGWPIAGIVVAAGDGHQEPEAMLSDNQGGAYIAWSDDPVPAGGPTTAFLQHVSPAGEPVSGWPAAGKPIVTTPGSHGATQMVSDDLGGVLAITAEFGGALPGTPAGRGTNHSAVRFLPTGEVAPGWPSEGVLLLRTLSAVEVRKICSDGAGGAYFGWNDNRFSSDPANPFTYDIYAQHVLADGRIDPRWPPDGLPIASGPNGQYDFDFAPDGEGGAFIAWQEFRDESGWRIYAKRIRSDGAVAPGWELDGNRVTSRTDTEFFPKLVSDDMGGFWVVWEVAAGSTAQRYVHMGGDGQVAPGWTSNGELLNEPAHWPYPISDGEHGLFIVFEQHNEGPGVWAQRIYGDGVTATLPVLVSAESQAGQATLRWSTSSAELLEARVERRTEDVPWSAIGAPRAIGPDLFEFVDSGLAAGRYAYRLAWFAGGTDHFTAETWLDLNAGATLALAGFRPNPAIGEATLAFALPDDRPARLDVIDVKGRVVHSREVGSLGGGTHVVRLDGEALLGAGMYWIRLRHPERTLTAKGLVVR